MHTSNCTHVHPSDTGWPGITSAWNMLRCQNTCSWCSSWVTCDCCWQIADSNPFKKSGSIDDHPEMILQVLTHPQITKACFLAMATSFLTSLNFPSVLAKDPNIEHLLVAGVTWCQCIRRWCYASFSRQMAMILTHAPSMEVPRFPWSNSIQGSGLYRAAANLRKTVHREAFSGPWTN